MVSPVTLLAIAAPALAFDLSSLFGVQYPVKYCNPFFLPYTCSNTTEFSNECCFEKDGLMLQAQFWDYNTTLAGIAANGTSTQKVIYDGVSNRTYNTGIGYYGIGEWIKEIFTDISIDPTSHMPIEKAFTIHGLWSDKCDGSYEEFCQPDLELPNSVNISGLFSKFNKPELLNLMETYWINTADSNVASDSNMELWQHEYNTHATCMNTVNPSCFTDTYTKYEAVIMFWQRVTQLWDTLNTYEFLAKDGILPSITKQYKLSDIQDALKKSHGDKEVFVGCTKQGVMNEIWYYHLLKGSVFTGTYKSEDSTTQSTCPENVWYIPKK